MSQIVEALQFSPSVTPGPWCFLDPGRVHRTECPPGSAPSDRGAPITVGYSASRFFVVEGQERLSAAVQAGDTLIPARLAAQDPETIAGQSCAAYFRAHALHPESALDSEPFV